MDMQAAAKGRWIGWPVALLLLLLAASVRWAMPEALEETPYLAFYPAVVAAAALGGFWTGMLTTIGSTVWVELLFGATSEPLSLRDPMTLSRIGVFLAGSIGISLAMHLWRKAFARQRSQARELAEVVRLQDLANVLMRDLDDRIIRWNTGCQQLYGFTNQEALGHVSHELLQTRFPEPMDQIRATLMTTGRWEGEVIHTAADGREIVVASQWLLHNDGSRHRAVVLETNTDITGRRQTEKQLQWVVESAPNGFVMVDTEGRIMLVNARTEKLFGYRREELLGRPVEILIPEQFHAGHCEDRARYMARPETRPMGAGRDLLARRKDGTQVPVEIGLSPIRTDHGTLVLASIVDISERKQAQEALQSAHDSAERAKAIAEQANRAKDHFLAVLSHELRTPLTPVVMGVSLLQDRPDLDPTVRETLEMIRRNVEMEAHLIDDLLDVTRIARGKIELNRTSAELGTVISRAVEVCRPDIESRGVHFGVDTGGTGPYWVQADVARLQQVFWNLLKNAIKFTPRGGCVGVRCRPNATHIDIEVNDSGIGIAPEVLPRVFNAFEQAERSITRQFGGLGLGLTISKALVEMHGGTISAHSEGRNKGSTFRIRLPIQPPVGRTEKPVFPRPPHHAARALHILLVEDHAVTAKMMRWVLTEDGHRVETAGDVAKALELASQHPFDLLVSDLGLPDGSGHDLMRQLRQSGHTLPGIALSGYGQEEDIRRSREAGFAAHLTKPASRESLIEAVALVTAGESAVRV